MKRAISLILSFLILTSVFTGCSQNSNTHTTTAPAVNQTSTAANNTQNQTLDLYEFEKLANTVKVTDTTVTFKDNSGNEVTVNKNPQKVMILINSFADIWYQSGGDVIARVESTDNLPEAYIDKPSVGNMSSLNTELIVSMQPDLVVISHDSDTDLVSLLKQNNITCVNLDYNSFSDYLYILKIFTSLNGRDDLYTKNGTDLLTQINEIIAKTSSQKSPSVLLLFASSKSVKVRLESTATGEMLKHLGCTNVAQVGNISESEAQTFSMERIVQQNPDFIFVQTMGDLEAIEKRLKSDVESNPAWSALDAVKNGKYIVLEKELYHYKPNTRYAEAYEKLAKILYPDLFN